MIHSAFSIDVEDGINIIMKDIFNENMIPTNRVVKNVNTILEMLEARKVKATFFILGEVAHAYPQLVKEVSKNGHEVGVHGYYHDQIFKLTPEKAKQDLDRAKKLIEDISGEQVYGYRAPAFSVCEETSWVLPILAELGYIYDSSIVPAKARRYGWVDFEKDIHQLNFEGDLSLIEVPMSVYKLVSKDVPICGGGYLRHLPYFMTKRAFKSIQKERPVIVYMHPYELDTERYPDFFYKAKSTLNIKRRLPLELFPLNKRTVKGKLEKLLTEFHFKPIIEIINDYHEKGELQVNEILTENYTTQ